MDFQLKCLDQTYSIQCHMENDNQFTAVIDDQQMNITAKRISPYELFLIIDGKHYTVFTHGDDRQKDIQCNGQIYHIEDIDLLAQESAKQSSVQETPTDVVPPMPAIVTRILIDEGDQVDKGQSVIIVSAMKMETTLSAPYAGIVNKIHVAEGDKVAAKQILMDIEADQ